MAAATYDLEDFVQLHERITIFYVVDGWLVLLANDDECVTVHEARGETIADALENMLIHLRSRYPGGLLEMRAHIQLLKGL